MPAQFGLWLGRVHVPLRAESAPVPAVSVSRGGTVPTGVREIVVDAGGAAAAMGLRPRRSSGPDLDRHLHHDLHQLRRRALVFYEVVGGRHAWPSSPLAEPDSPVVQQLTEPQGYTTFDIDATADAWAFFEQHTRKV